MIKFKSPRGTQQTLCLMGKVRNIFSVPVGRYIKTVAEQSLAFKRAKDIWDEGSQLLLAA